MEKTQEITYSVIKDWKPSPKEMPTFTTTISHCAGSFRAIREKEKKKKR